MTIENHYARSLWTLFEPIHAVTYFSPEARDAFAHIGFTRYWDGYFAGRAAPLGAVTAAPVTAIFSGFAPMLAGRALPAVWDVASPESVLDARSIGAARTLRRLMPDEAVVAAAAALLGPIARAVDAVGRPLAAANSALAAEPDPYRELWQATATLREHRGDGHVIALVAGGIAGLSTLILRCGDDLEEHSVTQARGWTAEEWAAESLLLISRGLLNEDRTISSSGKVALQRAEDLTDQLASPVWQGLSPDELRAVGRSLAPIARACFELYPRPNPIGMPAPWDPVSDPTGSPTPAPVDPQ